MAPRGRTIRQRIELDGGKAIKKELEALGKSGEKAFKDLQKAVRESQGPTAKLATDVTRLKNSLRGLRAPAAQFARSWARVGTRLTLVAAGAAAAAGGLIALARAATESADRAEKTSQALGVSAAKFKEFEVQARIAGLGTNELVRGFGKLNVLIAEAEIIQKKQTESTKKNKLEIGDWARVLQGSVLRSIKVTKDNIDELRKTLKLTGETTDDSEKGLTRQFLALKKLGVDIKGLQAEEALFRIADAMRGIEDPALKAGLAGIIFGERVGPRLLPLLNQGREGLQNLSETLKDFGIGVADNDRSAKIAARFADTITLIVAAIGQRRENVGIALNEAFQKPLDDLVAFFRKNSFAIDEQLKGYTGLFKQFTDDVRNTLVFENIEGKIVFVDEGQVTEANRFLIIIRDAVISFARTVKSAFDKLILPAWNALIAIADKAAGFINKLFGTDFSGGELLIFLTVLKLTGTLTALTQTVILASAAFGVLFSAFRVIIGAVKLLSPLFTGLGGVFTRVFGGLAASVTGLGTLVRGALVAAFTVFGIKTVAILRGLAAILLRLLGWPALLISGLILIIQYWDDIKDIAQKVFDAIKAKIADLWEGFVTLVKQKWDRFKELGNAAIDFVVGLIVGVWNSFVSLAARAWARVKQFAADVWDATGIGLVAEYWNGFVNFAANAFARVKAGIAALFAPREESADQRTFWQKVKDAGLNAWDAISDAAGDVIESIGDIDLSAFQDVFSDITSPFQRAFEAVRNLMTGAFPSMVSSGVDSILGMLERLASGMEAIVRRIEAAAARAVSAAARIAAASTNSGGGGAASGFATGGYVRGKGTATSDSIPAWLSNGEFIIRAAAVKRYGVEFFRMLNGLQFSGARGGKGGAPAFALGGLVDHAGATVRLPLQQPSIPQQTATGKSFDLHIGTEVFSGLFAPQDTAFELEQFAARSSARSAGSKPAWFGGRR